MSNNVKKIEQWIEKNNSKQYVEYYSTFIDTNNKFKSKTDKELDDILNMIRKVDIRLFLHCEKRHICEYNIESIFLIAIRLSSYFKRNIKLVEVNCKKNKVKKIALYKNKELTSKTELFFSLTFKDIVGRSIESRVERLFSYKYINKKLLKLDRMHSESLELYSKKTDYVSDMAVSTFERKEQKNKEYLESKTVFLDDDNEMSLYDILNMSKQHRVSEIYNVSKQMSNMALEQNKNWLMITITAPSKFHINPSKGHNSFDLNLSAKDSDTFITDVYRAAYKELSKKKYDFFGVWCKEPHRSGAVHMHCLLYINDFDKEMIKHIFTKHSKNAFNKHESKFINDVSINFVEEDKEKGGSGSSYIFKYIMKTLGCDEYVSKDGRKIEIEQSKRISSHMSTYAYKRYSFIKINNKLSSWRAARKIVKSMKYETNKNDFTLEIQKVFDCVLNNDYMKFSKMNIKCNYEISNINDYNEDVYEISNFEIVDCVTFTRKRYIVI